MSRTEARPKAGPGGRVVRLRKRGPRKRHERRDPGGEARADSADALQPHQGPERSTGGALGDNPGCQHIADPRQARYCVRPGNVEVYSQATASSGSACGPGPGIGCGGRPLTGIAIAGLNRAPARFIQREWVVRLALHCGRGGGTAHRAR